MKLKNPFWEKEHLIRVKDKRRCRLEGACEADLCHLLNKEMKKYRAIVLPRNTTNRMSAHMDLLDHFKSETSEHKTGRLRTKPSNDAATDHG